MKTTVKTTIKIELENKYGWYNINNDENKFYVDALIKDIISIMDEKLIKLKNISIKK